MLMQFDLQRPNGY